MGGAAGQQFPYQNITTSEEMPKWKKELMGFTPNAPEYSPFKALSRQAGTQAKIIEGMTTRPSWSAMYEAYGVKPGTDLTPYIQATRTGSQLPTAPIPASPSAESIPEFTAPSEQVAPKKEASQGGLMSLRKYAKGGDTTPKDLTKAEAARLKHLNDRIGYGQTLSPKDQRQLERLTNQQQAYQAYQTKQDADRSAPSAVPLSQAMNVVTPFYDVNQQYGQYGGVTNPIYQQALDQLRSVSKTPEQFGQATGIMSSAAERLMQQAGYTPQQVQAAQMSRGDIRDVAAQLAQVERYKAAEIERTQREAAAQTQGPKSWTDPGVARQYMNPYTQNVLDQELFEANRQAQMRENQQRSQATQQKAFGGTRAALQESEGRRNLGYLLSDIENKGLQQAYGQGMGQFQQEQQLGSQVGLANTQAINQLKSQYMQMGLTEAQANQAAINAASQFNTGAQNLAYNNYVAQQLQAQMANQQADLTTAQQNAQLAQQAAIQNQQAGLTGQGLNLQALNQAGQMGQGIGALGSSMWNLQQNIPQMWGAAGQTVQNLAQQAATGAQQTAQNWWGGMSNAYAPVTNMLTNAPGGTKVSNVNQAPR